MGANEGYELARFAKWINRLRSGDDLVSTPDGFDKLLEYTLAELIDSRDTVDET